MAENQQIIIQIINLDTSPPPDNGAEGPEGALPVWRHVFEGLSDEEIADVEKVALQRSDLTRSSE